MSKYKIKYPQEMIPWNLSELISRLEDSDNRKVGRNARKEEERGEFSWGLIQATKKAIQEYNKANYGTPQSGAEARVGQILTVTNSDGKRQGRKW